VKLISTHLSWFVVRRIHASGARFGKGDLLLDVKQRTATFGK
jgi:hypothetical protein